MQNMVDSVYPSMAFQNLMRQQPPIHVKVTSSKSTYDLNCFETV